MKRVPILTFCIMLSFGLNARNGKPKLDVKTQIDSVYVFGFDLRESRSAKGGIWNIRTGKPETPLNYTQAQNDTIDSLPVVRLYRQVVPGNHPLNGWEIWTRKDGRWICIDGGNPAEIIPAAIEHYCVINNPLGHQSGLYIDKNSITYVKTSRTYPESLDHKKASIKKRTIAVSSEFATALAELFDQVILSQAFKYQVMAADAPSYTFSGKNGISIDVPGFLRGDECCEKFIKLLYRYIAIAEKRSKKSIEDSLSEIIDLSRDFRQTK